jgi:NADPH-dependent 2,4-dienoyl-CoA reductase/sulfur reductase-like enzyme
MVMNKSETDVLVIGGGPAGLVAAASARKQGARRVVVVDRNDWLGGILPQCIHDGFGVEELGESLTGPEYSQRCLAEAENAGVEFLLETMVLEIKPDGGAMLVGRDGMRAIKAKAVIMATGCRERTRWHSMIAGTRPSGIYTAGVAQAFTNLYNRMVGKRVVILGSGNVGLIMARRMKLEGADVECVIEIMPKATGLTRNVVQCLEDYDIPLLCSHTVTEIHGKERLEAVTIAKVNDDFKPMPSSERKVDCDTLLLSLGLIPENELLKGDGIDVEFDPANGGPLVDDRLQTTHPGIFTCGNCLHVHDTVDVLAVEAVKAGRHAALYATGKGVMPDG